jgi:thiol-disulfide isomerase/thioredoxin
LVAVAAANLFLLARSPDLGRDRGARAGATAPAFSGKLLDGGRGQLSDFRGRVVLLDFWATWCLPCVAELPALVRVQRELVGAGRAFTIVGVNIDGKDSSLDDLRRFAREHGLAYPNFVDDGTIADLYGVETIPHLVLLDREGRTRRSFRGATGEAELRGAIEQVLR